MKKGMFLRIFFGDTDCVSSFSLFPYNNATFEQYLPKFSLLICYCKMNNYSNKQRSSQQYLVNYVRKCCAKFQNDWFSRFWVMMYTDFKNNRFQKNALKFCSTNSQLVNLYRNPAWSNGRSNTHNFVNFAPIDMKFLHNILEILCNH